MQNVRCMKVVALSCPQCGGSQDISDNLRELECRYCGIMLRVERFPNGELERLLTESKEENAELSIRNRILEIQNAIHRMDKAWETRREAFMVTTKSGQREPSTITGLMGVLFGFGLILLGGVMLSASSRNQEIGIAMPIVGVLAIIFGFSERSTSRTYE